MNYFAAERGRDLLIAALDRQNRGTSRPAQIELRQASAHCDAPRYDANCHWLAEARQHRIHIFQQFSFVGHAVG